MRVFLQTFFIYPGNISKRKEFKDMAGTKAGGQKAAATNKAKYGPDFYARIGSIGGQLGHTGGFYANRDLARKAGQAGGRVSRRGAKKTA